MQKNEDSLGLKVDTPVCSTAASNEDRLGSKSVEVQSSRPKYNALHPKTQNIPYFYRGFSMSALSGTISLGEFKQLLAAKFHLNDGVIQEAFHQIDSNHSEQLDRCKHAAL
eukprot:2617482-Amphidinium_carterae.1